MAAVLHLIFDKSALQSFSLDESNWLDHFYRSIITPLFFAEVLADLEKEAGKGRTPEQIVGELAHKTPDMNSTPCVHHSRLATSVLYGDDLRMNGRIPRDQGKIVELDDKRGIYYEKSPEEDAPDRWHEGRFFDVERQFAKSWRRDLCNVNHDRAIRGEGDGRARCIVPLPRRAHERRVAALHGQRSGQTCATAKAKQQTAACCATATAEARGKSFGKKQRRPPQKAAATKSNAIHRRKQRPGTMHRALTNTRT